MSKISVQSPQEIVPIERGRLREIARAVLDGENVKDYEKLYQVFAKKREGYRLKQDIILAE